MKLLSGVSSLSDLCASIDAGVDEVYCGVLTKEWLAEYSNIASINRVDRLNGNLRSYDELSAIIKYAHNRGVKVNLALNSLYTQAQEELLNKEIGIILCTGIDAIIVADLGLISIIKEKKFSGQIHAGSGLTVFNSQTAGFLGELGVSRIVLPRDLTIDEIRDIVEDNPDMQFEVFIMNGRCRNSDGFCTFQHGISDLINPGVNKFLINSSLGHKLQELLAGLPRFFRGRVMDVFGSSVCATACSLNYKIKPKASALLRLNNDFVSDIFSCGGCYVRDFLSCGVSALKIVGRSFPLERKIKDIRYLRSLINTAANGGISAAGFFDHARNSYKEIFGSPCGKNCYY